MGSWIELIWVELGLALQWAHLNRVELMELKWAHLSSAELYFDRFSATELNPAKLSLIEMNSVDFIWVKLSGIHPS